MDMSKLPAITRISMLLIVAQKELLEKDSISLTEFSKYMSVLTDMKSLTALAISKAAGSSK